MVCSWYDGCRRESNKPLDNGDFSYALANVGQLIRHEFAGGPVE